MPVSPCFWSLPHTLGAVEVQKMQQAAAVLCNVCCLHPIESPELI